MNTDYFGMRRYTPPCLKNAVHAKWKYVKLCRKHDFLASRHSVLNRVLFRVATLEIVTHSATDLFVH